MNTQTATD